MHRSRYSHVRRKLAFGKRSDEVTARELIRAITPRDMLSGFKMIPSAGEILVELDEARV